MRKITFIFFNFTRHTTSAPLSLTYLKALAELFIGAVLAVVDSVTEVRYKSLTELAREAVAPEDALLLVLTEPVARRTDQRLVAGGLARLRPVRERG